METPKKYFKKDLYVNGIMRPMVVDGEATLANVLRKQLGLTGTKQGCKAGQCGICSVILNGKVVRSCVTKMKNVPDRSEITTVEGLGTPDNLHPLQLAFIKTGAPQCAFCIPGFLVSAKALLDTNPNPTRQEVRAWFMKHRNLCRCTGYKPIVDAVMMAAAVLRGETDKEDLLYKFKDGDEMLGSYAPRPNAVAKVCGTHDYGSDIGEMLPEGALRIGLVLSEVSHANILSIDTSEAEKMPGVKHVITHKDVKGTNRIKGFDAMATSIIDVNDRPILCDKKIHQYAEPIAMVLADTQEHADAAAKKVKVDVELLPAYLTPQEALAEDAIQIHPGFDNLTFTVKTKKGEETEPIFEKAPYTAEASFRTTRQPHLVLEPDVGFAYYDDEGRLTVCTKSIFLHFNKVMVAEGVGVELDNFRMISNNMGATFGYKCAVTNEGLLGVAAMVAGVPVVLETTMEQHITYTGKRAPAYIDMKMACDKNGKLIAMEEDHLVDHGPYSSAADDITYKISVFMGFGYDIPNVRGRGRVAYTNHAYCTAFRSYGSTQAMFASESLIDELAEKAGIDPFEIRYRNIYREGDVQLTGQAPDTFSLEEQLNWIKPKYYAALERAKARNTDTKKYGVGLAICGYSTGGHMGDTSAAEVELTAEGVTVYNCWQDHGQGSDLGTLTVIYEALRPLGISTKDIKLVMNDTAKAVDGGISAGSRGQVYFGNAMVDACNKLMDAMKKEDGSFRTYDEMVEAGIPTKYLGNFSSAPYVTMVDLDTLQGNPCLTYMYGVVMTEVEVDITTGKVTVESMTLGADCGKIINKCTVDGQMYGGLAQAIGLALKEDFEDLSKHKSLIKCGIPYIEDIPDNLEVKYFEVPRPHGPFGAAGVGELPLSSPHAAVMNAIKNACGVRITELPALPEKVLAGLKALQK